MKTDRIKKYYQKFIEREIGELSIAIAPIQQDVPILKFAGIDNLTNTFIIEFDIGSEGSELYYWDEDIEIHTGTKSERIKKIILKFINKENNNDIEFKIQIRPHFEDFRKKKYEEFINSKSMEEKLRKIGRYDLIERQLIESSDVFHSSK